MKVEQIQKNTLLPRSFLIIWSFNIQQNPVNLGSSGISHFHKTHHETLWPGTLRERDNESETKVRPFFPLSSSLPSLSWFLTQGSWFSHSVTENESALQETPWNRHRELLVYSKSKQQTGKPFPHTDTEISTSLVMAPPGLWENKEDAHWTIFLRLLHQLSGEKPLWSYNTATPTGRGSSLGNTVGSNKLKKWIRHRRADQENNSSLWAALENASSSLGSRSLIPTVYVISHSDSWTDGTASQLLKDRQHWDIWYTYGHSILPTPAVGSCRS